MVTEASEITEPSAKRRGKEEEYIKLRQQLHIEKSKVHHRNYLLGEYGGGAHYSETNLSPSL